MCGGLGNGGQRDRGTVKHSRHKRILNHVPALAEPWSWRRPGAISPLVKWRIKICERRSSVK